MGQLIEGAGIKQSLVPCDTMGVSGRVILEALIDGQRDTAPMAGLAKRRRRSKIPALTAALTGISTDVADVHVANMSRFPSPGHLACLGRILQRQQRVRRTDQVDQDPTRQPLHQARSRCRGHVHRPKQGTGHLGMARRTIASANMAFVNHGVRLRAVRSGSYWMFIPARGHTRTALPGVRPAAP